MEDGFVSEETHDRSHCGCAPRNDTRIGSSAQPYGVWRRPLGWMWLRADDVWKGLEFGEYDRAEPVFGEIVG